MNDPDDPLNALIFELGADPHAEFESKIFVGVGASVAACLGHQADGIGFGHPLLDADFVAVQTGLTFNCGEFAIIERWVMHLFPDAEELDGIPVS